MKNAAKRIFSCKNRSRYSRKRATFCRNFANRRSLTSPPRSCGADSYERPRGGRTGEGMPGKEVLVRVPGTSGADNELLFGKRTLIPSVQLCECLAGSFSAVSKRKFASKSSFDSISQALQDLRTFAPLQPQDVHNQLAIASPFGGQCLVNMYAKSDKMLSTVVVLQKSANFEITI